jgi:hypothetical protein
MSPILTELREAYQALEGAETRADVGRVYETLAGYDIAAEQPDDDVDTLREYVNDYICEVCYEYGIHILDVTGESVSDDSRSYGPRY